MERILEDAEGILDALVAKALEGDVGAGTLLLNRLIPALKAQAATVEFAFDASAPASKQVEAILSAISSGALSPDIGRQVIEAIGALSAVRVSEELEARIEALEEARLA